MVLGLASRKRRGEIWGEIQGELREKMGTATWWLLSGRGKKEKEKKK